MLCMGRKFLEEHSAAVSWAAAADFNQRNWKPLRARGQKGSWLIVAASSRDQNGCLPQARMPTVAGA